jgi:hypothetical protein
MRGPKKISKKKLSQKNLDLSWTNFENWVMSGPKIFDLVFFRNWDMSGPKFGENLAHVRFLTFFSSLLTGSQNGLVKFFKFLFLIQISSFLVEHYLSNPDSIDALFTLAYSPIIKETKR